MSKNIVFSFPFRNESVLNNEENLIHSPMSEEVPLFLKNCFISIFNIFFSNKKCPIC